VSGRPDVVPARPNLERPPARRDAHGSIAIRLVTDAVLPSRWRSRCSPVLRRRRSCG